MPRNPFQQLYVGEKVDPEEFVEIFSDKLVPHALQLFQPGHVVLSGVQGSGKSMLFKLFQPEVRLAYATMDRELPIPRENTMFIGAGININTSRCNEFGNRRTEHGDSIQELMFGDFFNYVVAADILKSIKTLSQSHHICRELNLKLDEDKCAEFANSVTANDVWEGYLKSSTSLDELSGQMLERISLYRRYMNANDKHLSPEVANTKTSAGEPIKVLVRELKKAKIVPKNVEFFILVDQYEELATIKSPGGMAADYRSVVNKMISRDPTVSYRIGTRGYAWRNHLNIFGSHGQLEEDRDYKLVEVDARLRKNEQGGTSIFADFANDVFARRMQFSARIGSSKRNITRIADALGKSPLPIEEAKRLAGKNPEKILKLEKDWPKSVTTFLKNLTKTDPLSAKLGEVWIRQKGVEEANLDSPPWEQKTKQYWKKERVELALLQIAGKKKQRAIFHGEQDILGLSGSNILVLLSICQFIWDYASQASSRNDLEPELPIKNAIQTIGIFQAARSWLDRIPSDYGRSDDRFKLVQLLGEKFSTTLLSDLKMSNPGQNGISFSIEDLRNNPETFDFLVEAVDYGNLVMVEHATRTKDRKRRLKFYLNPLYCPIYRVPYQHTKEPLYLKVDTFLEWLAKADIVEDFKPENKPSEPKRKPDFPLLDMLESTHG